MLRPDFPGVIDDALRYRFLRHHTRDARVGDLFAQAVDQTQFDRLVDRWINEDWVSKHADLAGGFSTPTIFSVFRRDLLRDAPDAPPL
jgi:hypothetical protein